MALQVFGLEICYCPHYFYLKRQKYLKSCKICARLRPKSDSQFTIFMLESRLVSCWSRLGPRMAEVSTQGPDMNNYESLCLTLKLRRGFKKRTKHRWTMTCGGRPDRCGLHRSRRSRRNRVIPWANSGHLSPGCHKGPLLRRLPKRTHVVLSRSHIRLAYKIPW